MVQQQLIPPPTDSLVPAKPSWGFAVQLHGLTIKAANPLFEVYDTDGETFLGARATYPDAVKVVGDVARAREAYSREPNLGVAVFTLGTIYVGDRYCEVWRVDDKVSWYVTFGLGYGTRDTVCVGQREAAVDWAVRYLIAPQSYAL